MNNLITPNSPTISSNNCMHIRAVCAHLQAVSRGQIRNLIVNISPGHGKSLLGAVFWPAWVWIDPPEARWFSIPLTNLDLDPKLNLR
jgi:hypothetical protein